ncbi:MAG TPA: hypothetical protein VF472_16505 [Burkholderiaceae bacterium]
MWTYKEESRPSSFAPGGLILDPCLVNEAGVKIIYKGIYQEDLYLFVCTMRHASEDRKFMFPVFFDKSSDAPTSIILAPLHDPTLDFSFIEKMTKDEKNNLANTLASALENNHLYQKVPTHLPVNVVLDESAMTFFDMN